jgi:hypothetical protein
MRGLMTDVMLVFLILLVVLFVSFPDGYGVKYEVDSIFGVDCCWSFCDYLRCLCCSFTLACSEITHLTKRKTNIPKYSNAEHTSATSNI